MDDNNTNNTDIINDNIPDPTDLNSPNSSPAPGPEPEKSPIASPAEKKKDLPKAIKIVVGIIAAVAIFVVGMVAGAFIQAYQNNSDYPMGNDPNVVYKPMIYLYPEQITEVSVTLGHPNLLTTTYPHYNNGWQVIANPDGTLRDLNTNREYYGLYWEGAGHNVTIHDDGFVIPGADTAEFLEEKLTLLGLTDREANEFIVYWLPKLERNAYNYIHFETRDEIDSYMPLSVSPNPDSVIRIIMDYQPLDSPIEVTEQQLATPERSGFTVVEWGGAKVDDNILQ